MIKLPFIRAAAIVTMLGGLALANPVCAAPSDTMSPSAKPPSTTLKLGSAAAKGDHDRMMKPPSPEEMKQHVENRIKTLHAKLKITPEQESAWSNVAEAMRDSEANVSGLIQERHKSAKVLTAVEDLESYQKIAQAHSDGLKNVIAAFTTLYDKMPDDQQKNADTVFGSYEGHFGHHGGMMHSGAPSGQPKAQ